MSVLVFDEELGRKIRKKDWSALSVSTYQLMIDAIKAEDNQEAIDLNEYFMDEALVCKRLFDQWVRDTQKYLLFKDYGEDKLKALNIEIYNVIDLDRERACWDRDIGWQAFVDLKEKLTKELKNNT